MRSKRLPGLPVLCISDGNQLGKVRQPVVDPKGRRVVALLVACPGIRARKLLPMATVHSLGSHAVTVRDADELRPPQEFEEMGRLLKEDRVKVLGSPVVTARGTLVGTIADYDIGEDGTIEQVLVTQSLWKALSGTELRVPGEMLMALGKDAAIVADDVLTLVPKSEESKPESAPAAARRGSEEV